MKKTIYGLYITFAVIRDTALGSGNVLGIQLHNCHINLGFKNSKLHILQNKICFKCVRKKSIISLSNLPKIRMFKNVFVLKKLHVIMPNPLKKKKMVTLDIRKHLLHYILPVIFKKKRFALKETSKKKKTPKNKST